MQAVIVSFDSLAASSLGCYGNEWIETPHWDQLAASGTVFDRHFAESVGPSAGRSWFTGRHALSKPEAAFEQTLGQRLKAAGISTRMIVAGDAPDWLPQTGFDATQILAGNQNDNPSPDQIPFAQLVRAGLAAWNDNSSQPEHRLLWLHSRGPETPPAGFDDLYFEDFEERGLDLKSMSAEDRAAHPAVYAGAVSLIDHWLGELISGLNADARGDTTLLIVMAARGRSWPQLNVFRRDESSVEKSGLSDLQIQAPLLMKIIGDDRFKDFSCYRSREFTQPCDLTPTLLDWFRCLAPSEAESLPGSSLLSEPRATGRSRSFIWVSDEARFDAVRTAEWLCVRDNLRPVTDDDSSSSDQIALFVKPDDLWDVDNIAGQQPEVIAELLQLFPHQST